MPSASMTVIAKEESPPSSHHEPSTATAAPVLLNVRFRTCRPTDIPTCYDIETASYPAAEAASKSALQYRQHHCSRYFRCAVLDGVDDDHDVVIGFVCSTKCHSFHHESMSVHEASGRLLAIHSVVVAEEYRRRGIATRLLKDYIQAVLAEDEDPPEKFVLLSKAHLLAFYVNCGFQVMRPSAIIHGDEQWYDLELDVEASKRKDYPACFTVDAFADPTTTGTGNSAGVVLLEQEADSLWMQTVAQEFNLSETAFVWPKPLSSSVVASSSPSSSDNNSEDDEIARSSSSISNIKENQYCIRYFTPTVEVPLCGHATLAAASILYQTSKCSFDRTAVFFARDDVLRAEAITRSQDRSTVISMTFPTKPVDREVGDEDKAAVHAMLAAAFEIDENSILFLGISGGLGDLFVEVTHDCFSQISYQLKTSALLKWDGYSRGVIVCCQESGINIKDPVSSGDSSSQQPAPVKVDFLSRFFAPKAGIDEDPVTGSAHCALAPYFCAKLNKTTVIGKQVSRRGGVVECEMLDDDDQFVRITGTAVTTMSGTLWIPGR